ncbi:MAG: hypothetical protein HEQ39_05625 [Rhizobacter sp.]
MTDPQTQREQTSIKQLTSVSQARQIRLQTEREALAERERVMEQAWENQRLDEDLLAQQRAQWVNARQAWAQNGGAVRHAIALRRDKELLVDMAALVARRRAGLQVKADRLNEDISAWAKRWHSAQEFEESLEERARVLRTSLERASERQRDEESLMALTTATYSGASPDRSQRH